MPDPFRAAARLMQGRGEAPERKLLWPPYDLLPSFQSGKPLPEKWSLEKAVDQGFRVDALVYSAFRSRANAVGSIPWIAEMRNSDGTWELAPDHDIIALLENPSDRVSRQQLHEVMTYHLDLAGNALLHKLLLSRTLPGAALPAIKELRNLIPEDLAPVPLKSAEVMLSHYEYRRGLDVRRFETGEIIHAMYPDPADPFWGISPLQPMSRVVDTQIQAIEWNRFSMQNRAVADGVFSSKSPMNPKEYKQYKRMIKAQHQGAEHAREPWVIGGDMTWQQMSQSAVEMDFVESLKFWRELVLSGADVPPVVAGFYDQATLANATTSRRIFWVDKLVPLLHRISAVYSHGLVPHFAGPTVDEARRKLRVMPDLSEVEPLRESRESQAKVFESLVSNGVPYNDAARVSGLPLKPIEGAGDEPHGISEGAIRIQIAKQLPSIARKMIDLGGSRELIEIPAETLSTPSLLLYGSGSPIHLEARDREDGSGTDLYTTREGKVQAIAASKPIIAAARASEAEISAAFSKAVLDHRAEVKLEPIRTALAEANPDAVLIALNLPGLESRLGVLSGLLQDAVLSGTEVARQAIKRETGVDLAEALEAMPALTLDPGRLELPAELVETNRKGVEKAARSWIETGPELKAAAPDATPAELFQWLVGLASQQVIATLKFYRQILKEGGGVQKALNKAKLLIAGFLFKRAALVAGQETTLAVHQGQIALWQEAVNLQVVESAVKTWIDGQDSRVCPICIELSGQTVDIGDDYFSAVLGEVVAGPGFAHVHCRCGELITRQL